MPTDEASAEPLGDPREHVAEQLRDQARSCAAMGSPLYAELLTSSADDVAGGGPVWTVLSGQVAPGRGDALALRFMAAVHRLVLTGQAPDLAACYPSAGGQRPADQAWEPFVATVAAHAEQLPGLVSKPCQTNEVGRCAGLVGGFLDLAARTAKPLRLLEIGASGGLNLRWDRYRYGGGGASWGPADSPVDLTGHWHVPPPHVDQQVQVVGRDGCDPDPVDVTSAEGRLTLTAALWADQRERHERLLGAFEIAESLPVTVDRASVDDWLPARLATLPPGTTSVVFHSVVDEYLAPAAREAFHAVLGDAADRATADTPVAWLRMEPVSMLRAHGITLTTWPGGRQRLLGTCRAHGTDVVWRR